MKDEMTVEGFHQRCAELLGAEHTYKEFPYRKRTRWNNRTPGNGRYPGRGIIRVFGSAIHISLRNPRVNRLFPTWEAALEWLEQMHTS